MPGAEATLPELRSLSLALLDSLGDKTLALSHQKRANRILAARIAELQARLETTHTKKAVESPSNALLEGYRNPSDAMPSSETHGYHAEPVASDRNISDQPNSTSSEPS